MTVTLPGRSGRTGTGAAATWRRFTHRAKGTTGGAGAPGGGAAPDEGLGGAASGGAAFEGAASEGAAFEGAVGGSPGPAVVPAEPSEKLQIRALQALCRQVFGFRLAMTVLSAPAALLNAAPGLGARLVGAAVVVTFMVSYVLFRDWERFGPLLLRHPSLLAADTLCGAFLLVSAGPDTTLAYVSVCTPLLAGLVYGWRGAAGFASLEALILLLVHTTLKAGRHAPVAEALLLPGLCVITGAMGSTLRGLMLRFGAATQALTTVQARLAATEAVSAERARLAREMHDSVAKTLYGVALAADGLAVTAATRTPDPARIREQADLVSRSARRAAAESRELLTDLRRHQPDPTVPLLLWHALSDHARAFTTRTGLRVTCHWSEDAAALPSLPTALTRPVLAIATEALENAHRHASATRVDIRATVHDGLLRLTIHDDGTGLPPGTTLQRLRDGGHFGLLGMVERAAQAGARIRIGRGGHEGGTEVRLDLRLPAADPVPQEA
ncbi:two-component sensor histidine kinase [Streptomyces dangxiongensis]|uniref:histidine kinase n=1 Tax=Streptomyces dangxiongensis TaxID=1442032 RepID=A0A3G2JGC3_9ACTN|nr:histidine kinase [Streptomyces dangxiongensis]AYN39679.1 two-component sensor histidine kinase [Streptomyces dangxiongensis]